MPARPLPASGAGEYVIDYRSYPTHLGATLYRRTNTGALVELGYEKVPYHLVQETFARVEGTPTSDELGWTSDPEELGAFGSKLKKFAKRVAKSKLGKIVKSVGKMATAVVPGGAALAIGSKIAKGVARKVAAKKKPPAKKPAALAARTVARPAQRAVARPAPRPAPPPPPVYEEAPTYTDDELDSEAYALDASASFDIDSEEMGAAKKSPAKKPAAKKPAAKKPPAKKPAPAAKKPAAKKPAAKKPPAKKPAPAAKKPAAKKPAAKKPATKANPAPAKKPLTAKARVSEVKKTGGPAQTLLKAAATAPTPQKAVQAQKLASLVTEIEDAAPELAAVIATLPDTPPEDRDLIELRALEAAQKLADTPPAERAAVAEKIERRVDAYKVTAPDGTIVWVPLEDVG